jgi:2-keto-3-deoxy-6-phosphogluconate aldolase
VAVGSELCDKQAMADGRFEVIEQNARQFLEVVRKARVK